DDGKIVAALRRGARRPPAAGAHRRDPGLAEQRGKAAAVRRGGDDENGGAGGPAMIRLLSHRRRYSRNIARRQQVSLRFYAGFYLRRRELGKLIIDMSRSRHRPFRGAGKTGMLGRGRVPLPVGRAGFKPVGGRLGVPGRFDSCLFRRRPRAGCDPEWALPLCAGIAASAAPPRNDKGMVIASAAKQSPALWAGLAASAAPPRDDRRRELPARTESARNRRRRPVPAGRGSAPETGAAARRFSARR